MCEQNQNVNATTEQTVQEPTPVTTITTEPTVAVEADQPAIATTEENVEQAKENVEVGVDFTKRF